MSRLYLATPPRIDDTTPEILDSLLASGAVACVRIALATGDEAEWRSAAARLSPIAARHQVAIVIEDHWRLVRPLGLDGVHLARSPGELRAARDVLGAEAIIGIYAAASRHRGMLAAEAGADYVAFGPAGQPGTLGSGETADDALFTWWNELIEVPSVAEGAMRPEDARRLARTADFVVPDPALFHAPDPVAALAAFAEALPEPA